MTFLAMHLVWFDFFHEGRGGTIIIIRNQIQMFFGKNMYLRGWQNINFPVIFEKVEIDTSKGSARSTDYDACI